MENILLKLRKGTIRIFELLEAAGVKTASDKKISDSEILLKNCDPIPLKIVVRREATGNFLKRHPQYVSDPPEPFVFADLKIEFFLKTENGEFINSNGNKRFIPLKEDENDPFIFDVYHKELWALRHPEKAINSAESHLGFFVKPEEIIGHCGSDAIETIKQNAQMIFIILGLAFEQQSATLVDLTLEFGLDSNHEIVVSKFIDNNSWSLRDWYGNELNNDKKLAIVAEKVLNLSLPKQTLIFWDCQPDDLEINFPEICSKHVLVKTVSVSGRGRIIYCHKTLDSLSMDYSEKGIIIMKTPPAEDKCPVLIEKNGWFVIKYTDVPMRFPTDLLGHISLPAKMTEISVFSKQDAVNLAINIFAQTNPALYMYKYMYNK